MTFNHFPKLKMISNHSPKPIYLDYHSTTPVDPRIAELMLYYLTTAFGNASSIDHSYGDEADKAVKTARQQIADLINASPKDIIFTSGATESLNLAIQGSILGKTSVKLPRIALSPVEHKAVIDTCEILQKKGFAELIYLKVDQLGRLDLENLENLCKQGLDLLCVMAANNEIGNIYPIEKISYIAQQYEIPFLCDASQAVGKIPLNFQDWGLTYLTISAHKLYGPKGVGALVVKKGHSLEPLIYGGGHQKGMRSGTLNVVGIVGLGEACRLRQLEMNEDESAIALQRNKLQQYLQDNIPELVVNGNTIHRLAGNLHVSVPNIPNSAVIARIRSQLAISTGAACSSGVASPSHVLRAMKLPESVIEGALRIGVGKFTTDDEIDLSGEILAKAIAQVSLMLA
jgi:cysteine desulfurase